MFKQKKLILLISEAVLIISCVDSAAATGRNSNLMVGSGHLKAQSEEASKLKSEVAPSSTSSTLYFDLGPGTSAPPETLDRFAMTKIPSPPGNHSCTLNDLPIPTGAGGSVDVGGTGSYYTACIGNGWQTWSHGYVGDAYPDIDGTQQTITLPTGTGAFYFYVEPNDFDTYNCSATATSSSGSLSTGTFSVAGYSGAKYVGFYDQSGTISKIDVECEADAGGFATGEYGWAAAGAGECDVNKDGKFNFIDVLLVMRTEGPRAGLKFLRSCKSAASPADMRKIEAWRARQF